jgi:hypothetical protein
MTTPQTLQPPAATQADRLPVNFTKELRIIDPLQGRSDYNLWAAMTKKVLEQHDLEDLVDNTIDRPPTGHAKYEAWRSQSKSVSTWLVTIISKEIFSGLFSGHWKWKYADETFEAIKTIVMGHGHNTAHIVVTQALDTRRSQFGTVEHYVNVFKARVQEANRVTNATIVLPWTACSMLLKGLEPEFPAWAKINQRDLLSPNKANNMEESEFLKLCAEAIDEGRAQSDNAMYAQSEMTKNELSMAKMDTLKTWRKAPPQNKDPTEYAEECREGADQMDSDGNCGFCGRLGHPAQDCLHLAASTPRTWKPVWGLWCYSRAKGRSSTPPRNAEYMKETSEFVNLAKIAKVGTNKSKENDDTVKHSRNDEDECYIRPTSFIGMAVQKEQSPKKATHGKSPKMLPRAKIRGLVGYERDNGYIFKRWPDTVKIPKPIPPSWSNLGTFNISYYEDTEPVEFKIETEVPPPSHEQHTTGRVETLPITPQPAVKHAYDIIETGLLKSEEAVEVVAEHALTEPQISPSNEQRVLARSDEGHNHHPAPIMTTNRSRKKSRGTKAKGGNTRQQRRKKKA